MKGREEGSRKKDGRMNGSILGSFCWYELELGVTWVKQKWDYVNSESRV